MLGVCFFLDLQFGRANLGVSAQKARITASPAMKQTGLRSDSPANVTSEGVPRTMPTACVSVTTVPPKRRKMMQILDAAEECCHGVCFSLHHGTQTILAAISTQSRNAGISRVRVSFTFMDAVRPHP